MKRFTTTILSALAVLLLLASTPEEQVLGRYDRSASNHYGYPYPNEASLPVLTPAPAGYEAFYIDHYGRHGSRWLTNADTYDRPVDMLQMASDHGVLTFQGERLLKMLRRVQAASIDRVGDLTDVGAIEHHGIAERMFKNFPTVFAGDAHIDARSTVVIRCILSMANETMTLRGLNPQLRITTDASYHDMYYMGWGHGNDTLANGVRKRMDVLTDSLYAARVAPERFVRQLYRDPTLLPRDRAQRLMLDVFSIAGSLQTATQFDDMDLYSFFTNDEIFELWRLRNIYWYVHWANAPQNGNRMPNIERDLLRDIVDKADAAIAGGERGASLRFGHETCTLPLACLMELDNVNYSCDDLDTLHEHWQDYNIFPKGCNIQIVLYRRPGSDDVLAKVLLNEHEATLPVDHDMAPYCHWSHLRDFFLSKINAPMPNWDN